MSAPPRPPKAASTPPKTGGEPDSTLLRQEKTANGEALVKAGDYTQEIATAGSEGHFGVQVGDKIYEMYSTKGIPANKWASKYEYRPSSSTTGVANPVLEVVPPQ